MSPYPAINSDTAQEIISSFETFSLSTPELHPPQAHENKATAAPTVPTSHTQIPTRIEAQLPLAVKRSSIAGAGRGLFVLEEVHAGTLIFKIPNPFLNVIRDGAVALRSTCDYCLASMLPAGLSTVPGPLVLACCSGCKVYYYCGKECQRAAWKHHHGTECKTLRRMGGGKVEGRTLRAMVRLLSMQGKGMFGDEDWLEFRKLDARPQDFLGPSAPRASEVDEQTGWMTKIINTCKEFVDTSLSKEDIQHLLFAIHNNEHGLTVPILRGKRPLNSGVVLGGEFEICQNLDPFLALINSSCLPNTSWRLVGRAIHVYAQCLIAAGDELFITYTATGVEDYIARRERLASHWGISDCGCALCELGNPGFPVGEQRDRVVALAARISAIEREGSMAAVAKPLADATSSAIVEIMHSSPNSPTGVGTWPSQILNRFTVTGMLLSGMTSAALKRSLWLFYIIEPLQIPPVPTPTRLSTWYTLMQLSAELLAREPPTAASQLSALLVLRMRDMFVQQIGALYGRESTVWKFELRALEGERAGYEAGGESYVELCAGQEQREEFYRSMMELANWAGEGHWKVDVSEGRISSEMFFHVSDNTIEIDF